MEDAGTVDLRGDRVLPWILKVINTQPVTDPSSAGRASQQLTAWGAAGAHRIDRNKDGVYEQTQAIRIMDAWWPRLVEAEFKPTLGQALFDRTSFGHDAPGRDRLRLRHQLLRLRAEGPPRPARRERQGPLLTGLLRTGHLSAPAAPRCSTR